MLKAALKKWIIVVVGIDTWNYTKNNKLLTLLDFSIGLLYLMLLQIRFAY